MRIGESGALYLLTVFVVSSGAQQLGVPRTAMLAGVLVATLVGLITTPYFGRLSDRVGRRPLYLAGSAGLIVLSPLFFSVIDGGSPPVVWLAAILGVNLAHDLMYGPQAAWFCELFDTRVRYSGVSVGSQVGAALGGGLALLVASWSLDTARGAGVIICLAVFGLVSFLSAWFAGETAGADIDVDRPSEDGDPHRPTAP
jgi:MFS family permease